MKLMAEMWDRKGAVNDGGLGPGPANYIEMRRASKWAAVSFLTKEAILATNGPLSVRQLPRLRVAGCNG